MEERERERIREGDTLLISSVLRRLRPREREGERELAHKCEKECGRKG